MGVNAGVINQLVVSLMNLTNWDAFPYSLYNRTYKSEIASGPNAFRSFGFSV